MHLFRLKWLEYGRAGLSLLIVALVISFSSAAFGDVFDKEWIANASDPSRIAQARSEIILYKMKAGYVDFSPLAMQLVTASQQQENPAAALALAELAVAAAPNDSRAHAQVACAAADSFHSPGRAILAIYSYFKTALTDPWVQMGLSLRLMLILSMAGLMVVVAILVSGMFYFFPLFAHDVRDRFPASVRTFTPMSVLVFFLFLMAWLGGGMLLFILLPAIGVIAYMPLRTRIMLVLGLVLALCAFPTLDGISKMSGDSGERAWTLYRVLKGDAGSDLEGELNSLFAADDYKALHARALVARRAGKFASAEGFLSKSQEMGGDAGLLHFELGSLKLLQKDFNAAVVALEQAAKYRPDDWMLWYNLSGVHLARLDLDSAATALGRARALNAPALEQHQTEAGEATAGGTQAFSRQFPSSWVTSELLAGFSKPYSEWSESLWAVMGASAKAVRPPYLMAFLVFVFVVAQSVQKKNLTARCDSCGSLRCHSCNTVTKGSEVCGGCFALTRRDDVDETIRAKLRLQITKWSVKTAKASRWGEILFPGWSNFLYRGGFGSFVLGLVWALSLGVILSSMAFKFQYLPWIVSGFSVSALVLWVATHLIGVYAGRRR
jgi:tetratricopeptide (TPR) repeat protein